MVKDDVIRQCFVLANWDARDDQNTIRQWLRDCIANPEARLVPVRIVAVRIVAEQIDGCSSPKEDGRYSGEKRRRIARLIEDTVDGLLSGAIEIPATLPIPASGVHRHRAEPRRLKKDEPSRFADCGVHRVREFSYDKRSLKFGQLLTDVD